VVILVEVKGSMQDSKQGELEYGPKDQGPKESRVKPNMQKAPRRELQSEERGFEGEIWSVQII
jgi:hypothetical protein